MFNIVNESGIDLSVLEDLIQDFMPFAQERMGFKRPPGLFLKTDSENAKDPLGRTAAYGPDSLEIAIYVDGRHPKDILRSLAHELVHHAQNLRGDFEEISDTAAGYAQNDPHMREMEREAYEQGNLCFRDWEDSRKKTLNESIYYEVIKANDEGENNMSIKDWKNEEINYRLMKKFGLIKEEEKQEDNNHPAANAAAMNIVEPDVPAEKYVNEEDEEDEKDEEDEEDEEGEEDEKESSDEDSLDEYVKSLNKEAAQLLNEDWARRWLPKFLQPHDEETGTGKLLGMETGRWGSDIAGLIDPKYGQDRDIGMKDRYGNYIPGSGLELEAEKFSPEKMEQTLAHYAPAGFEVDVLDDEGNPVFDPETGEVQKQDISQQWHDETTRRQQAGWKSAAKTAGLAAAAGLGAYGAGTAGAAVANKYGALKAIGGWSSAPWSPMKMAGQLAWPYIYKPVAAAGVVWGAEELSKPYMAEADYFSPEGLGTIGDPEKQGAVQQGLVKYGILPDPETVPEDIARRMGTQFFTLEGAVTEVCEDADTFEQCTDAEQRKISDILTNQQKAIVQDAPVRFQGSEADPAAQLARQEWQIQKAGQISRRDAEKQRAAGRRVYEDSPYGWVNESQHNEIANAVYRYLMEQKAQGIAATADADAAAAAKRARVVSLQGQTQGGGQDLYDREGGAYPSDSALDYLTNLKGGESGVPAPMAGPFSVTTREKARADNLRSSMTTDDAIALGVEPTRELVFEENPPKKEEESETHGSGSEDFLTPGKKGKSKPLPKDQFKGKPPKAVPLGDEEKLDEWYKNSLYESLKKKWAK